MKLFRLIVSMLAVVYIVHFAVEGVQPVYAEVPPGCWPSYRGTYFADVTGDGMADAIVVNSDRVTVRRSDGTKFEPNESWTSEPYYGGIGTYFADVTGDGMADAIVVNSDRVTVRRSDGTKFEPNESWTSEPYYGGIGTYFADVTGDGMADAIVVNRDRVTVRRSDGTKFEPNESWTSEPYYGDIAELFFAEPFRSAYLGTEFADVTGDGMADAIVINQNIVLVTRSSDGTSFLPNAEWTDVPYYGKPNLGGHVTYFADVTGDGMADAIVVNRDRVTVRRSDGTKFEPNESWTSEPYYSGIGTYFADVTGDGMADAIVVNSDRVTVRRSDGTKFEPNESWTSEPYYGDVYPSCLS
jgi:SOS-response transcriptional repressor LexA